MSWISSAFQLLSSRRPISSEGISPIGVDDVLAYCELFLVDDLDSRTELLECIDAMDNSYVKVMAPKLRARLKAAAGGRS